MMWVRISIANLLSFIIKVKRIAAPNRPKHPVSLPLAAAGLMLGQWERRLYVSVLFRAKKKQEAVLPAHIFIMQF